MPFGPQVSRVTKTRFHIRQLPRLLSFVTRAMAVAQLTNLHISIPASGASPGEVPEEYFPRGVPSRGLTDPRRVSFASGVTVVGDDPLLDKSLDIQIHAPVCPDIVEDEDMDSVEAVIDVPVPVPRPPPGFERFSWPREEWGPDVDPSLFDFSKELPGWFPWMYGGQSVDPPSLPISPVLRDSLNDSVVTNVGSSREESNITSEAVVVAPTVVDDFPAEMVSGSDIILDSLSPVGGGPFSEPPVDAVTDLPKCLTGRGGRRPPGFVPRWRLAREGPFLMERSSSSIRCLDAGCPFR